MERKFLRRWPAKTGWRIEAAEAYRFGAGPGFGRATSHRGNPGALHGRSCGCAALSQAGVAAAERLSGACLGDRSFWGARLGDGWFEIAPQRPRRARTGARAFGGLERGRPGR
jgi:hypothetical protein